jgi:hypothetical protein
MPHEGKATWITSMVTISKEGLGNGLLGSPNTGIPSTRNAVSTCSMQTVARLYLDEKTLPIAFGLVKCRILATMLYRDPAASRLVILRQD